MSDRFPSTQWSLVLAARDARPEDARKALGCLVETYWYPVYAFIRSRANSKEDAEDLTQSFFASLLEHSALTGVRPELGRFRAFLLASAKNFLANAWDKERAAKRGGRICPLPLDFGAADVRYRLEAPSSANPEADFERRWAYAAFEAAENALWAEFSKAGKAVQFEAFRQYFRLNGDPDSYAGVAEALDMNEAAVKVAVHRARRRFGELLREQIAGTVDGSEGESGVASEFGYLQKLLSGGA